MIGIPKHFNTLEDVNNSFAIDKDATKKELKVLLEGRFSWFQVGKLAEGEEGITDDTHKVIPMQKDDGSTERWQYEMREDSNAWMYRIGLTVERINELLGA